jgi:hypothetical protein
MPKKFPPRKSNAVLIAAGFDPQAAPDLALASLRSIRTNQTAPDDLIATALGEISTPEAAAMLAEMETNSTGHERREIRRAIFRLRQHGIEAPASQSSSKPSSRAEIGESITALLSPIDPEGARIVWIMKDRPGGGLTRLWGLTSHAEGLVGATLGNLSRRQLRAEREELERRAGAQLIDADWRLADFILCEAYRATPESRRSQVGNFLTLRSEIVATSPELAYSHPIYSEFKDQLSVDPNPELLKEPEVAAIRFPPQAIRAYAEEIAELRNSPLVLNPIQQEDRVAGVVERAIDGLLVSSAGAPIRRRLEDAAYFLARRGKKSAAGWAASAAARIRDGADLKRLTFFQALVRSQLGELIAQEQSREREQARLVMTPAEAIRTARQRRR